MAKKYWCNSLTQWKIALLRVLLFHVFPIATYRKVANSRPGNYWIFNHFGGATNWDMLITKIYYIEGLLLNFGGVLLTETCYYLQFYSISLLEAIKSYQWATFLLKRQHHLPLRRTMFWTFVEEIFKGSCFGVQISTKTKH